jgi:hypothetical protein
MGDISRREQLDKQQMLERLAVIGKSVAAEVGKQGQSARGLAYGKLVTSCRTAYRQVRDWLPRTTPLAQLEALLDEFTAAGKRGIAQSERDALAALVAQQDVVPKADVKTPPKPAKPTKPKQPKPKPQPPAVNSGNSKAKRDAAAGQTAVGKVRARRAAAQLPKAGNARTMDERKLTGLDAMNRAVNEQLWDVSYDIASVLNKTVPNPSRVLWAMGCVRKEKSVWWATQRTIDSPAFQQLVAFWESHNVKCHTVRYHPDDLSEIRNQVYDELARETRRVHASLIERLESASKALDAARAALDEKSDNGEHVTQRDYDAVEMRNHQDVRFIINSSARDLQAAIAAAEAFDATEQVSQLTDACHHAVASEAKAFNAIAASKRIKGVAFKVAG